MVGVAQQRGVAGIGGPAIGVTVNVVNLAPPMGHVAERVPTASIPKLHKIALRSVEEAARATSIEENRRPFEHDATNASAKRVANDHFCRYRMTTRRLTKAHWVEGGSRISARRTRDRCRWRQTILRPAITRCAEDSIERFLGRVVIEDLVDRDIGLGFRLAVSGDTAAPPNEVSQRIKAPLGRRTGQLGNERRPTEFALG